MYIQISANGNPRLVEVWELKSTPCENYIGQLNSLFEAQGSPYNACEAVFPVKTPVTHIFNNLTQMFWFAQIFEMEASQSKVLIEADSRCCVMFVHFITTHTSDRKTLFRLRIKPIDRLLKPDYKYIKETIAKNAGNLPIELYRAGDCYRVFVKGNLVVERNSETNNYQLIYEPE